MKKLIMAAAVLAATFSAHAQNAFRGRVTDALTGKPLSGANISYAPKGGTSTDNNGWFTLDCSRHYRITISFLGYEPFNYNIRDCSDTLVVALIPSASALNNVEITATSTRDKSILAQPASISRLTPIEIKRATGLFLDDAINTNVTGVTMQRRAVSSGQQFNIRGYGNGTRGTNGVSSNFDGQGYKVYLNGIPVTDAEGITLMDDIDFGSVGNVEITKGPSGTLYGLAIAGVVNLKTVTPEKGKTSVSQDVQVGSYGLRRYTTSFQTGSDKGSLLMNYGHQESDGYMLHTASHKDFVNAAAGFGIGTRQTLQTYFGFSRSYDQRGGELTLAQYAAHDYSGNPAYIKNNAHSEIIGVRLGLSHTYQFNSAFANTTTVFGSGVSNNSSSAGGWTDKAPVNYGLRSTFDTRFPIGSRASLNGITGVEAQQQRAQVIGYAMIPDSNNLAGYNRIGLARSNQYTTSGNYSLFTEWTLTLPQDLSITAGVGTSSMKIRLNDRFYLATSARLSSTYERNFNGLVSPHFAINKVFAKDFSLYASFSKAFHPPVSSYFYIPFVSGASGTGQLNGGLRPEIGTQFEIGTKGALLQNRLIYEVAAFHAIFKHKMTAVAVPLNATTTSYSYVVNGGEQDDKGIEASIRYTVYESGKGFFRSVRPFANLTLSKFRYRDFIFETLNAARTAKVLNDYSGKAVAGVAPVTANVGIDLFTNSGLYMNTYVNYRDAVPLTSDGLNKTHSYTLWNAKLGFKRSLGYHFDLDAWAGVNNITGEQYYYMVFVNQLPDAYLPAPDKANYFGGVKLQYNF